MQVARAATSHIAGAPSAAYPSRAASSYVPLYLTTSLGNIAFDIEELEATALDRLKVLKAAETARSAVSTVRNPIAARDSIRSAVRVAERQYGLNIPPAGNFDRESRVLKDEASHFIVRLALCKTHEHRSWLLQTEYDLFNTRLDGTAVEFAFQAIEKANGPVIKPVTAAELDTFRAELDAVARGPCFQKNDIPSRYYKVAFEEVPTLVRHRKVFLYRGAAYVPERNILDVVAAQFRSKLSGALAIASKAVAMADNDKRMRPILDSIRQHFAASDDARKAFDAADGIERISLSQVNESIPAMPLCMANMMARLHSDHHLRHSARMQLGVFLKGCGLTMDDSLRFWRTEFGKGQINAEKFEKTYAYNIRHHYGKEGKRRNLTPFACIRVINDRPGPGEHNGCPYREFEVGRLKNALRSVGTDPNAINTIAEKAKEGNFQLACGMCFASSQPGHHAIGEQGFPEFIPNHPNEYFIEARKRRFAPEPKPNLIDDDIDDEEMLMAAEAAETQSTVQNTQEDQEKEDKDSNMDVVQNTENSQGKNDEASNMDVEPDENKVTPPEETPVEIETPPRISPKE